MTGIVGIVNYNIEHSELEEKLRKCGDLFKSQNASCIEEYHFENSFGLCVIHLSSTQYDYAIAQDNEYVMAFFGTIWGYENEEKKYRQESNENQFNLGGYLLEIFKRKGVAALCGLNGRYAIACYDKEKQALNVINDRKGFCKIYYTVSTGKFIFASEYKAILSIGNIGLGINSQALGDFLSLGYSTGNSTFFKNVHLVPPASIVNFSKSEEIVSKKYWDYSFHSENDVVWNESDYIDQFCIEIEKAVARQIVSVTNIGIPLSAGYDSRTLAGVVNRLSYQGGISSFSYGHKYAYDVFYGAKIATKLGYSHEYIPINTSYLVDNAKKFVWMFEGTVNCLNSHMLLTFDFIKEKSIDAILTGFFGDILCGSGSWIYSIGVYGGNDDEAIIRGQYSVNADIFKDEDLAVYVKEKVLSQIKNSTFENLRAMYFQCPSENRYYRSRYYSMHERQRRYTSFNLFVFDPVANVLCPFIDNDFVDFILHVPASLVIFQNLYRKMIVKYFPNLASIPHNETRLPLNAGRIRKGLKWRWDRMNKNPIIRSTIGRRYSRMNDNYINSASAIRGGSREFVIKNIRNNDFLAEYFKMEKVHEMLDNHMEGKKDEQMKILALLTLALWHKLFIEGEGFKKIETKNG